MGNARVLGSRLRASRLPPKAGGPELMARPKRQPDRLPVSAPRDLMRWLIPHTQALDLARNYDTANAVANATRQFGVLDQQKLGHLAPLDMLTALAELDLQAKKLPPGLLEQVESTLTAMRTAEDALQAATKDHRRAKAEV